MRHPLFIFADLVAIYVRICYISKVNSNFDPKEIGIYGISEKYS